MMIDLPELLGFVAGTIISVSALPRIIQCMRNATLARAESLSRNGMISFGNVLWIVYGLLVGSVALTTMSVVATALNGTIMVLAIRARRENTVDGLRL